MELLLYSKASVQHGPVRKVRPCGVGSAGGPDSVTRSAGPDPGFKRGWRGERDAPPERGTRTGGRIQIL